MLSPVRFEIDEMCKKDPRMMMMIKRRKRVASAAKMML